jgi:hypothetical protein
VTPAADGSTPPTDTPATKKPGSNRPRPTAKLSDEQKTGKQALNSFAQLAALLNKKEEKPSDDSASK